MRFIHLTEPGRLELNFLWLPTWLGINGAVKDSIEKKINDSVVGLPATDENLDRINDQVIALLVETYPIVGLIDYLEGIKFVQV